MAEKPTYEEVEQRVRELEKAEFERKIAVDALRESEDRYRSFVKNFRGIAFQGRMDFTPIFFHGAVEEITGYTEREFLNGKPRWDQTIHPEDLPALLTEDEKRLHSIPGYSYEREYRIVRKDGAVRWVHEVIQNVCDDSGKPAVLQGAIYDITERKQAEEELRESEERFRGLADSLPQIVFETDEKGTITFVNSNAFDYFGYTESEFDKKLNALQMICPEDRDRAVENIQKILSGEILGGSEYTAIRKDGSTFPVEIHSIIFSRDNKPMGLRGIIVDLSKRKQVEEALRESEEKLARSKKMESLGLLAGGVAHDLNNVLSGIVGYPELLLLDLPEDSKLRKPLEIIQESGNSATAIVQDLLTVARGVATTKGVLNLNDLIGDYLHSPEFNRLKQFHPTATVKTNLNTDLLNISGSHVHIRKMVMNLVSNAAEAIEGGGHVTISTTNRYVDRPLRGYDDVNIGEYAILSVSDDGSGISSDDLERIFEPFYTKKIMGRSGTGLGLAVVWNVVQDHKGYIDVVTGKNGTTFELYFPITRDEISDKTLSIPIKDYKGNKETILVVDDEENQREISCEMLDKLGYKTKAVSSGQEAVEYLKETSVDLILLDMIMDPGINGRETYEKIIKIHPKQKAIIVSGFSETGDVKEAQRLGAGEYVKKPLTVEKLGLAVKEELEK